MRVSNASHALKAVHGERAGLLASCVRMPSVDARRRTQHVRHRVTAGVFQSLRTQHRPDISISPVSARSARPCTAAPAKPQVRACLRVASNYGYRPMRAHIRRWEPNFSRWSVCERPRCSSRGCIHIQKVDKQVESHAYPPKSPKNPLYIPYISPPLPLRIYSYLCRSRYVFEIGCDQRGDEIKAFVVFCVRVFAKHSV